MLGTVSCFDWQRTRQIIVIINTNALGNNLNTWLAVVASLVIMEYKSEGWSQQLYDTKNQCFDLKVSKLCEGQRQTSPLLNFYHPQELKKSHYLPSTVFNCAQRWSIRVINGKSLTVALGVWKYYNTLGSHGHEKVIRKKGVNLEEVYLLFPRSTGWWKSFHYYVFPLQKVWLQNNFGAVLSNIVPCTISSRICLTEISTIDNRKIRVKHRQPVPFGLFQPCY